jgi:hypothetical protein
MPSRTVFGAFNQGQIPDIACFNKATTPLGLDFVKLIAALQQFVNDCVVPVWGTPARLSVSKDFVKGSWAVVFLDNADQAGALAYHELTPDGFPISKVFVETILADNESISVAASHELVEMLVDTAINMWTMGPSSTMLYACESADPVESFSFKLAGFDMTDFVYPSYFEVFRKAGSTKFDYLGKVGKPFQILKGGYQIVWKNGKETQVLGSKAKLKAFRREDRRQHRSDFRLSRKSLGEPLRRSRGRARK